MVGVDTAAFDFDSSSSSFNFRSSRPWQLGLLHRLSPAPQPLRLSSRRVTYLESRRYQWSLVDVAGADIVSCCRFNCPKPGMLVVSSAVGRSAQEKTETTRKEMRKSKGKGKGEGGQKAPAAV